MPPRLLVTLICLLTLVFTLLSGLAKAIGAQQPINPPLEGFIVGCEDKPQPCWYGIVPGVTMIDEAKEILREIGYQPYFESEDYVHYYPPTGINTCKLELSPTYQSDEVGSVRLEECANILLGGVFMLTGPPDGFNITGNSSLWMRSLDGHIALESLENSYSPDWSLYSHATRIWLFNISFSVQYGWHGFIPAWRYCQLEPLPERYCS